MMWPDCFRTLRRMPGKSCAGAKNKTCVGSIGCVHLSRPLALVVPLRHHDSTSLLESLPSFRIIVGAELAQDLASHCSSSWHDTRHAQRGVTTHSSVICGMVGRDGPSGDRLVLARSLGSGLSSRCLCF
jgi:hypothetical protein